jgi:PD-(D/E)XK endonuclease
MNQEQQRAHLYSPISTFNVAARKSYRGDVEFFGVYSPDTNKVYLIPVDVVPEGWATLRLKKPKNNQEKKIIWAADYEL